MPSDRGQKKLGKRKQRPANAESYSSTAGRSSNVALLFIGVLLAALSAVYYWQYYGDGPSTKSRSGSERSLPEDVAFTVIDIPGKGKGAIATRDIQRGEVVLQEYPLFVVPQKIDEAPTTFIYRELAKLRPNHRQAFMNLSYVNFPEHLRPEDHPEHVALAIFQTNAVSAGPSAGIFPRMARLNHGCSSAFNVVYNWRNDEQRLVVHAIKSIQKGQELLTTYYDSKKPRSERRAYLSTQYGFHCTCDVCSLPDDLSKASDARLVQISRLYSEFATWGSDIISGAEAIASIKRIWEIEEEEGYWSERGQLAADAVWVAASHSDASATRAWAERAVEWFGFEIGADTPQVKEMESVAARPQSHRAWGAKKPLDVGRP